jgi:hypothetical protein
MSDICQQHGCVVRDNGIDWTYTVYVHGSVIASGDRESEATALRAGAEVLAFRKLVDPLSDAPPTVCGALPSE